MALAVISEGNFQVVPVAVYEEIALVFAAEIISVFMRAIDREMCGTYFLLREPERQQRFPDLLQRQSGMLHCQLVGVLDVLQLQRNRDCIRRRAGETFAFDSHS